MFVYLAYMLIRLKLDCADVFSGLAEPAVRNHHRARPARSALLLWRALAHRSGTGRSRRNPLSRDPRGIGDIGGPEQPPAGRLECRRYSAAPAEPATCAHG